LLVASVFIVVEVGLYVYRLQAYTRCLKKRPNFETV